MGNEGSREDFEWVYTDQPHTDRRKEILAKYPEIKKLMGCDPNFKWVVTLIVLVQMVACYLVKDLPWKWVFFWACIAGSYVSHSLTLAIHDISHNVAFGNKRAMWNRYFGMFANLPLGIPIAYTFKKYHIDHHRYLAIQGLDVDLPTALECRLFTTPLRKLIWIFLQPVFYGLRPVFINPKPITQMEIVSFAVQLAYDLLVYLLMGRKSLTYLLISLFLTSGFSIMTGHFISEHYEYIKGSDTTSYYGPLNWIAFNAGYHMEHHDFPNIPGSKLPLVKKIAPEYYDSLPYHYSWGMVIWDFIFKEDLGPFARQRRKGKINRDL